ncbi:MAG: hypothetical protein PWQ77_1527, partial [Kosmotogales bacterium]|nr:hypothetical protein [Kosmotogales bacterium]
EEFVFFFEEHECEKNIFFFQRLSTEFGRNSSRVIGDWSIDYKYSISVSHIPVI